MLLTVLIHVLNERQVTCQGSFFILIYLKKYLLIIAIFAALLCSIYETVMSCSLTVFEYNWVKIWLKCEVSCIYETWINSNWKIATVPGFLPFESNLQYLVYVIKCNSGLVMKFTILRKSVVELLLFLYLGLRSYSLTAQTKNKLGNLHWRESCFNIPGFCTRVRACF